MLTIRTALLVVAVGVASVFAPRVTQAQTLVIVINPDTGDRGQAVCDRDPPKGASKGWLKQHCKPGDTSQSADTYFDSFFDIDVRGYD